MIALLAVPWHACFKSVMMHTSASDLIETYRVTKQHFPSFP